MTKVTKQEKANASDLSKQSFVIQKGISRSGRAIKPKTIFGEPIIEIAKKATNTEKKKEALKPIAKVVKPKAVKKAVEKVAKVAKPKVSKTSPVPTTKNTVVKSPEITTKVVQVVKPQPSSNIPKGFIPVDITKIISAKHIVIKPKTPEGTAVVAPQRTNVNNVVRIVTSPLKSVAIQKPMTFEEREKEIQILRARLKKLEAEQENERKIRANATKVEKPIVVNTPPKVLKKVEKPSVVASKPIIVEMKQVKNPTVAKASDTKPSVTKTTVTKPAVTDERPSRVKKPTWKAIEQE